MACKGIAMNSTSSDGVGAVGTTSVSFDDVDVDDVEASLNPFPNLEHIIQEQQSTQGHVSHQKGKSATKTSSFYIKGNNNVGSDGLHYKYVRQTLFEQEESTSTLHKQSSFCLTTEESNCSTTSTSLQNLLLLHQQSNSKQQSHFDVVIDTKRLDALDKLFPLHEDLFVEPEQEPNHAPVMETPPPPPVVNSSSLSRGLTNVSKSASIGSVLPDDIGLDKLPSTVSFTPSNIGLDQQIHGLNEVQLDYCGLKSNSDEDAQLPTRSLFTLPSPCNYLKNDKNYLYLKPQRGVFKTVYLDFYDNSVGYPMLIAVWHYTIRKRVHPKKLFVNIPQDSTLDTKNHMHSARNGAGERRKLRPTLSKSSSIRFDAPPDEIRDVIAFYNLFTKQIKGLIICSNTNAEISSMCTTMCDNIGDYLVSTVDPNEGNQLDPSLSSGAKSERSSKRQFSNAYSDNGASSGASFMSPRPQSKQVRPRSMLVKPTDAPTPEPVHLKSDENAESRIAVHFVWLVIGRRNGSVSRWLLEVNEDHSVQVMLRQDIARGTTELDIGSEILSTDSSNNANCIDEQITKAHTKDISEVAVLKENIIIAASFDKTLSCWHGTPNSCDAESIRSVSQMGDLGMGIKARPFGFEECSLKSLQKHKDIILSVVYIEKKKKSNRLSLSEKKIGTCSPTVVSEKIDGSTGSSYSKLSSAVPLERSTNKGETIDNTVMLEKQPDSDNKPWINMDIFSSSWDGSIMKWMWSSNEDRWKVFPFPREHKEKVTSLQHVRLVRSLTYKGITKLKYCVDDESKTIPVIEQDLLISASSDGTVIVWDIDGTIDNADGHYWQPKKNRHLLGHQAEVTVVRAIGNSHGVESTRSFLHARLATASLDGTIRIWDLLTGLSLQVLEIGSSITTFEAIKTRFGELFVLGTANNDLVVWNRLDNIRNYTLKANAAINTMEVYIPPMLSSTLTKNEELSGSTAFALNESMYDKTTMITTELPQAWMAIGTDSGKCHLLKDRQAIVSIQHKKVFKGAPVRVNAVALFQPWASSSGKVSSVILPHVVTGLDNGFIVIWKWSITLGMYEMCYSFKADRFNVACLVIYDPRRFQEQVKGVDSCFHDWPLIISGGRDGPPKVWTIAPLCDENVSNGQQERFTNQLLPLKLPFNSNNGLTSSDREACCLSFVNQSNVTDIVIYYAATKKESFFVSSSLSNTVVVWSLIDLCPLHVLEGHVGGVSSLFLFDASILLPSRLMKSGKNDESVFSHVLSWKTTKPLNMNSNHEKEEVTFCLKNQNLLLTGGLDSFIGLWNLGSPSEMYQMSQHQASHSNSIITMGSENPTHEVSSLLSTFIFQQEKISSLTVFVPGCVTTNTGLVKLSSPPRKPTHTSAVANPLIISGTMSNRIIIWNMITLEQINVIASHSRPVNCLGCIYRHHGQEERLETKVIDGTLLKEHHEEYPVLLSGSSDHQLIFWDDALPSYVTPGSKPPPLTKDIVLRAFQKDLTSFNNFPHISQLKMKEPHLLIAFKELFYLALLHHREDFLLLFKEDLKHVISRIPFYDIQREQTLMPPRPRLTRRTSSGGSITTMVKTDSPQMRQRSSSHTIINTRTQLSFNGPLISLLRNRSNNKSKELNHQDNSQIQSIVKEHDRNREKTRSLTVVIDDQPRIDILDKRRANCGSSEPPEAENEENEDEKYIHYSLYDPVEEDIEDEEGKALEEELDHDDDSKRDILRHAISVRSLTAVRLLLDAWQEILNEDIREGVDQSIFHAIYHFNEKNLFLLAKKFPVEFVDFFKSLRLIHTNVSNSSAAMMSILPYGERSLSMGASSSQQNCTITIPLPHWIDHIRHHLKRFVSYISESGNPHEPQEITVLSLPLKFCVQPAFFHTLLQVSESLKDSNNDCRLFDCPSVNVIIEHYWSCYGWKLHCFSIIRYMITIAIFSGCIYLPPSSGISSTPILHRNQIIKTFHIMYLMLMVVYFVDEFVQLWSHGKFFIQSMKSSKSTFRQRLIAFIGLIVSHFLKDLWNVIDITLIVSGTFAVLLAMYHGYNDDLSNCFFALTAVMLWIKSLYFLRPHPVAGLFVAMVTKILRDVVAFVIVLASVLLGFAQAFWLMNNQNNNQSRFDSVRNSYYMSLMLMLGQGDEEDVHDHARVKPFTKGLMILFLIVMMLLMLNLLIALMGDSYAKAKNSLHALHRKEVMNIMVDQAGGSLLTRLLGLNRYRPSELVHVLKYTSDLTVEEKRKRIV